MIMFSCEKCGQKLNVEDKHSGKRVKCPKCGNVSVVPDNSDKIQFQCKNCGQSIIVPQIHAGKKGKCPKCKNPVVIPSFKKESAEDAKTFSIVCSMCDETIQVPESSKGQNIECPACGSYIETTSEGGQPGSTESEPSVSSETDEDEYEEESDVSEEVEGVDRRLIFIISGVAAVVVVGLIILVAILKLSGPRQVEEPVISHPESHVESDRESERPDVVAEEPVEAVLLPKPDDIVTNSIGMKLVYIPAGSFMMGSGDSAAQLAREYDDDEVFFTREFPQHHVRISEGFWMGQTEVTQGQYKSVMNTQPWSGQEFVQEDANNPAVCVSWDDALEFCRKLSQQQVITYRLASEAEWEYACRAGTTTRYSFGDIDSSLGDHAWFFDNTIEVGQEYAHSVRQKKPNPWGLYDMHGNVWEWCSDRYAADYYSNSPSVDPKGPPSGDSRCLRGGSWAYHEDDLRCSYRSYDLPGERSNHGGFRVVRSQLIPPLKRHVEPERMHPRQEVADTDLRSRPVASNVQRVEPIVQEPPTKDISPTESVSLENVNKIAFVSYRDGNAEIYIMNADGTGQRRLTNNRVIDENPALSPDGKKIAFASRRDGNHEIYVMNIDGTGLRRLTNSRERDEKPSWSPDGKKIAFGSMLSIHTMNADGSEVKKLRYAGNDLSLSWSPDGKKIAFGSYTTGLNSEIFVMNADRSDRRNLTNNPAYDLNPCWSQDGSKIVFMSERDGVKEIYAMNPDGSEQRNLTNNPHWDVSPSCSPFMPSAAKEQSQKEEILPKERVSSEDKLTGQTKIAFASDRDGNYEIYIMNEDGSGLKRLTNNAEVDAFPSWSPDGSKIAFESRRDGDPEIYIMNADGTEQTNLTKSSSREQNPSWSPDGKKIAFRSLRDENHEIYTMSSDGSELRRLTNNSTHDMDPSWSPDGKKIAFFGQRDGNPEIYIMNSDGSEQTRLTNNPARDTSPAWSPDGKKITFTSNRDGNYEIYVMDADGSEQKRLTNNPASDGGASWSSDGKRIAFVSSRDGNREIYIMNADGSEQERLTNNPASDTFPSWSPFLD